MKSANLVPRAFTAEALSFAEKSPGNEVGGQPYCKEAQTLREQGWTSGFTVRYILIDLLKVPTHSNVVDWYCRLARITLQGVLSCC